MRRLIELIRAALPAASFIALTTGAYALVDINDRIADHSAGMTRADYARWVNDSCLPRRPDERAIASIDTEGQLRCTIFGNVGYGRAARIVSAAVMEQP